MRQSSLSEQNKRFRRHWPAPKSRRQMALLQERAGLFSLLPEELMQTLLSFASTQELASLSASCHFFRRGGIVELEAKRRLLRLSQGKCLSKSRCGASWTTALQAAEWSTRAAAQQTCIALGSFHTTLLMSRADQNMCNDEGYQRPDACDAAAEKDCELRNYGNEGCVVLCAGRGFHGQLGTGAYDAVSEFLAPDNQCTGANVRAVCAGANHSVGYGDGILGWGLASSGELGHQGWTPIDEPIPRQVSTIGDVPISSVACGDNHTLVISAKNGSLWACGRGRSGQLGFGNFGDAGPLQPVDALRGVYIKSVCAGGSHSVALDANGNCWVWGEYRSGQLGLGLTRFDPELEWEAGVPWPCLLEKLPSVDNVWTVSAGGRHTLFTTGKGRVFATGSNKYGQLGLANGNQCLLEPHEVSRRLKTDGRAVCSRCDGRCKAVQVAAGGSHSMILTSCGAVFTAGANAYGQLGTEQMERLSAVFTQVHALAGMRVAAVSAGTEHSGAITDSGDVYLWGRGEWGNLGSGDFRSHFCPVRVEGRTVQKSGTSVLQGNEGEEQLQSCAFPTVVHVRSSA